MKSLVCRSMLWVVAGFLLVASQVAAAPVISVQQNGATVARNSTYTFPSTSTGVATSVLFTIFNNGNAALNISNPASLVSGSSAFSLIVSAPSSIAAGSSGVFRVRLLSGTVGTYSGTVTINSNDPVNSSYAFNIQGSVTGPAISVQQGTTVVAKNSTYLFPSTPAGASTSVLFTIYNTGTAALTISNPTALVSGAGFSQILDAPASIAAGGNGIFRVRLLSATPGTYTGTVTINSNDPGSPSYSYTVRGTVTGPVISVQQGTTVVAKGSTYTFPSTPAGVSTSVLFTIYNTGTNPLNIANPTALVTGNGFAEIFDAPASIAAGGSGVFRVRLLSFTPGSFTGTVSISSDDPGNNPYAFTVQGTVTAAPAIAVQQGTTAVASGSIYTFASTPAGVAGSVTFTINNTGSATLTIGNPSTLLSGSSAFSLLAGAPASIAAGSSGTFKVRLLSSTPGTYTGTVSISSNDPNTNPYTFTVQGTVSPAPVIGVQDGATVVAKGSTYTFPASTPAGVSTSVLFTIYNTGTAALNLSNPTALVTGTGFAQILDAPASIAAGGNGVFRVRLLSATPGTYTGTVTINSNDPLSPTYSYTIRGTVTGPVISVQQGTTVVAKGSTYTFPSTPAGVPASVLFTIYNTGTNPLNISNPTALVTGNGFAEIFDAPASIAVGGSGVFRVRLQSSTPGNYTGTVTISSNDPGNNPYAFTVQGTVTAAPGIGVTQGTTAVVPGSTYTFPSTPAGVPASVLFTINNTGSAALSLGNPTSLVTGNGFAQIVDAPASIAAGGSGVFRVRLQSSTPGTYTGTVTINSNDPNYPTYTFTIQGTVTATSALSVQQGAATIANGSTFTFPTSTQTGMAAAVTFTIRNSGTASLVLSNPATLVSGNGFSESQQPAATIAANGSTTFAVQILASTAGTYTGTVTIQSNDPLNSPFSFTVQATVTDVPKVRVTQAWDGATVPPGGLVTFADEALGEAGSLQFLIVNDGPGTLHLSNPTALVAGTCYSQLTTTVPSTLPAGQSTGVRVRLQCGTAGVWNGTFTVASDDPLNPSYGINLRGAVGLTLPPLRVVSGDGVTVPHEGTYTFPDTAINQAVSRGFTVFNDGMESVTIANPSALYSGDAALFQMAEPVDATILPGSSQAFRIKLLSSQTGLHSGTVAINTTDPTQKPFRFTVNGTVKGPDFAVGATPTSRTVTQGQSASFSVSLSGLFGFSSKIALSVSGLPAGASATFSPVTLEAGGTSTLQISTSGSTPAGTATLTLAATGGGITHTVPLSLKVQATQPATLSLTLSPEQQSAIQGSSTTFTVSPLAVNTSANVALSVSGLPAGVTGSFDTASVAPGDTAQLTLSVAPSVAPDSYGFTVTGSIGGLVATADATLVVVAAQAAGAPRVDVISSDTILNGRTTVVTVLGANLQGGTVDVPTAQLDPNNPVTRYFPAAAIQSVSADGTSMQVSIDASDTRTLDFYNLQVTNSAGSAVKQFRVLPPGPMVDLMSPRYPRAGEIYILSLIGQHLRNVTVSTNAPGVTLSNVDSSQDDRTNAFLIVSDNAPGGNATMTVTDPFGQQFSFTITVVGAGQSAVMSSQKVLVGSGVSAGVPDIYFQPFSMRHPGMTRVAEKGLVVEDAADLGVVTAADFNLAIYISYTYNLISFHWETVVLFDPVLGVIGDAILHGLGLGDTVHLGAYVFSFYASVDLTIYWTVSLFGGFTFPQFCLSATIASEIPGLPNTGNYFISRCVGGGGGGGTHGTTNNVDISSNGSCATVTPVSFGEGVALADVTQNACCEEPISVAASGSTFSGTFFRHNFSLNNSNAGKTSPKAPCLCPCMADVNPKQVVIKPGDHLNLTASVANNSDDECDYDVAFTTSSGTLKVTPGAGSHLHLSGRGAGAATATVEVNANQPADPTTVTVNVSNGRCKQDVQYCVIPTGESSAFFGWKITPGTDVAAFSATLSPSTADFTNRSLIEGEQTSAARDGCYVPGTAIPDFSHGGLVTPGTSWTVGQVADQPATQQNQWGLDSIGFFLDADATYAQAGRQLPCSLSTTQTMSINCPWGTEQYTTNKFLINVTSAGTTVIRGNATANPPH